MGQRFTSPNGLMAALGSFANKTTTVNTYADVGVLDCVLMRTKHFAFTGATNTLSVKILGSIDDGSTYPFEAEAEFDVTAGATVTKTLTAFYSNLKVQVKPKVNDTHGTLTTKHGMSTI